MAYQQALSQIANIRLELDDYNRRLRESKLYNNLNFNPKAVMGTTIGSGLLRGGTATTVGMADSAAGAGSEILDTIGPGLGYALLGSLPFLGGTQLSNNRKREAEMNAQQKLMNHSARNANISDILKSGTTAVGSAGNTTRNTAAVLMASGALTQNAALSGAGMGVYAGSGLLSNPVRMLATGMGINHYMSGVAGASNPMIAGMAAGPSALGHLGGWSLNGLGHAANAFGFTGAGSALGTGGAAIIKGGAAASKMALAGGPMAAIAVGVATTLVTAPIFKKIMTKINENSTGQQLLNNHSRRRPRVNPAHTLARQYSTTSGLDQQVQMMISTGALKTEYGIQFGYLSAIEKNTSLNRFMVEYIQEQQNYKEDGSADTSDNFQRAFRQTGNGRNYSGAFIQEDNLDYDENASGLFQGYQKFRTGLAKRITGAAQGVQTLASFTDILGYFKGGEDSPIAKYRRKQEENSLNRTAEVYSERTGLSIGSINALETSATDLANMGESSIDKLLAVSSGNFEVNKISAFKLMDIAQALGIEQENSFMGKFRDLHNAINNNRTLDINGNERNPQGFFGDIAGGIASVPYLGTALAGAGVLATGGIGGALAGLAIPAAAGIKSYFNDKRLARERRILTSEDSLEELEAGGHIEGMLPKMGAGLRGMFARNRTTNINNTTNVTGDAFPTGASSSIDEHQKELAKEEKENKEYNKRLQMYKDIHAINHRISHKSEGAYINYSKDANKRLNKFSKQFKKLYKCCDSNSGIGITEGILGTLGIGALLSGSKNFGKNALKFGGKTLGPAALVAGAVFDDDFGHNSMMGALGYGAAGAMTGAQIGSVVPVIGTAIGAVVGGALGFISSKYGTEIKKGVSTVIDSITSLFDTLPDFIKDYGTRTIDLFINPIKAGLDSLHSIYSWFFDDDEESSSKKSYGKNRRRGKQISVTQQSILENQITVQEFRANTTTTAEEYLGNMALNIAKQGGDPTKIDTSGELQALLKSLNKDQSEIGSLSIQQQNVVISSLGTLIDHISHGNRVLTNSLDNLNSTVKNNEASLGDNIMIGSN